MTSIIFSMDQVKGVAFFIIFTKEMEKAIRKKVGVGWYGEGIN